MRLVRFSTFISVSLFLIYASSLKAQLVEKIPNPGVTENLINYLGGTENDLFFAYWYSADTYQYHYDGAKMTPISGDASWYDGVNFVGKNEQFSIFENFSFFSNRLQVYLFDDELQALSQLLPMEGYEHVHYLTSLNGSIYVSLADYFYENSVLSKYENNEHTIISPEDAELVRVITSFGDELIIQYENSNDQNFLYTYDGMNLSAIDGIDENLKKVAVTYQSEDNLFLVLEDINNDQSLYAYDGISTFEITPSTDSKFIQYHGKNSNVNEQYITYSNTDVNEINTYVFDGTNFSQLALPSGTKFDGISNVLNEVSYVRLVDEISSDSILYKLDEGVFEEVALPNAYSLVSYLDIFGDAYYSLIDANNNSSLAKLDATNNAIMLVPDPLGNFQLKEYLTIFEDHMLLVYDGDNGNALFMYDGANFTEIAPDIEPGESAQFGRMFVKDSGVVYLSFYISLNIFEEYELVHKLLTTNGIPESEDVEITTDINSPYLFVPEDFYFSDPNLEDTLHSIVILEIDQFGEFSLNGQQIFEGDTILADEISGMLFNPPLDESGVFSFMFKVGDGQHYSQKEYRMQLSIEISNSIPYSADTTITTFVNQPYSFNSTEFVFVDADEEDSLHSIIITESSQIGSLRLENENVESGDTIGVELISALSYRPLPDEEIRDSFFFFVGDGKDYSNEINKMSINVVEDINSSIEENILDANVKIFPIPARDLVNVEIETDQVLDWMQIKLYNKNGQLVLYENIEYLSKNIRVAMKLDKLKSGTYFLVGHSSHGSFVERVIKIND